jgi:hypothetical protein
VDFSVFLGTSLLPAAVALSLLHLAMPLRQAMDGLLSIWLWSFDSRLQSMRYYETVTGTDWLASNLSRSLESAGGYLIALVPFVVAGAVIRRYRVERSEIWTEARAAAVVVTPLAVLSVAYVFHDALTWQYVPRGLNVLLLATCLTFVVGALRHRRDELDERVIARLVLTFFALLLLARMALRVVIHEQGFAIAMPAALVAVAAVVGWIPQWVDRGGGIGWIPRAAAMTMLAVLVVHWLEPFQRRLNGSDDKPIVLGKGADALRFDNHAAAMRDMLAQIDQRAGEHDTLLVLPQGVLLNYYAGLINPTGYVQLMPPEMIMYGQQNVLAALERSPPDWVVAVKSDPQAFGYMSFAKDYGRGVWRWISDRYAEVATTGDADFWMTLYRRRG